MNYEYLNIINNKLDKLVGVYDINGSTDHHSILSTLFKDELLSLIDDDTKVNLNNTGDVDINYKDFYYCVDIKIQDINKTYSFPNLTSVKKVKDILSYDKNHIVYVFIEYEIIDNKLRIDKIRVRNIESLEWSYLYIQNIGKGQLQIKNITRNEFVFNNDINRIQWLNTLKSNVIDYYDKLILKVIEYKSDWEEE